MRATRRRTLALTVGLVTLLVTSVAGAAPTAADRETARNLMDQGRDLRDRGNVAEALRRFQGANDIMHVPTTALEVAKTQVSLGLLVEARDTIADLRQTPGKHESQIFRAARQKAEELDASLSARVPSLIITVRGAATGQEPDVTVDGVSMPSAALGLPRSVDPGHHVVVAKTGSAEGKQEVDIKEAEQNPVEVTLLAAIAAPSEPVPVAEVPIAPPRKSHSPTALTVVGFGVAGGGLVAGIVTGVLSLSKKSDLSSQCPNHICGQAGDSTLSSANTFATASDVSFAVAGAGAILATVTLIAGHPAKPTAPPATGLRLSPWFAGTTGGVSGSF